MLISFTLGNFKSFESKCSLQMMPGKSRSKNGHIKNDCLSIAAIYGNNAAGKSNFIQGLKTMKSIVTDPLYSGSEPLNHWRSTEYGSPEPRTYFCIEFTTKGFLYSYILEVETHTYTASHNYQSWKAFTYPTVHECLTVSSLEYEPYRDGTIAKECVFEQSSRAIGIGKTDAIYQRKILLHRLNLCDAIDYSYEIKMAKETSTEFTSIKIDLEALNEKRNKANQRRYKIRQKLADNTRQLNKDVVNYHFRRCPLVLKAHIFENATERLHMTEEQIYHINNVREWFESELIILDTNDVYLPNNDITLEKLSAIIKDMDFGITKLEWREIGPRKSKRMIDSMPASTQIKIIEIQDKGMPVNQSTSFITKTGKGIFKLEFDSKGMKLYELAPEHGNDENETLYSESDGTVRMIELASMLIPTNDDVTFVVDEMDRRLHPMLTRRIIETYLKDRSPSKQLIFTTHETEILTTDLFRKDEIWFVQKKNGNSHIGSLDEIPGINYNKRLEKLYLEDMVLPGIPRAD